MSDWTDATDAIADAVQVAHPQGSRGVELNRSVHYGTQLSELSSTLQTQVAALFAATKPLRMISGSGAAATVAITVTGIATADTIVKVIEDDAGTRTDITDETSITGANEVTCTTTDTTGNTVEVYFIDAA